MERHLIRLFAIGLLTLMASGCPASTTLEADDGGSDAASDMDAAGNDAATADDAARTDDDANTDDASVGDAGTIDGWRSCAEAGDCVLAPNDCCGWCGLGTAADVDAVNAERLDAHSMAVCPEPVPCPACASGPLDPQVVAVCASGACEVRDLGTSPIAACESDDDCMVTYGNCCGCGGTDDDVIAVRSEAGRPAVDALFCAGGSCDLDCAPHTPDGWGATCDTGHCAPVRISP